MNTSDVTNLYQDFIKMAYRVGASEDQASELVQEFFLKLAEIELKDGSLDRLIKNGTINRGYVYKALRNMLLNLKKHESRFARDVPPPDATVEPISDTEIDVITKLRELDLQANHDFYEEYYEKLFTCFVLHNHTYRSFHRATEISISTVFYEMKYLKHELQKHLTYGTNQQTINRPRSEAMEETPQGDKALVNRR